MRTDKNQGEWKICVLFGLGIIIVAFFMMPHFPTSFPKTSAKNMAGYGTPVIAFEMARSVDDLQKIFGAPDDPERAARIIGMNLGNKWDFLFMAAYAGFIAWFLWAAFRQSQQRIFLLAAALGIVAGGADAVENIILLGLTKNIEAAPYLSLLVFPVWIKFLCISFTSLIAGLFLSRQKSVLSKILGIICILGSAITIFALFKNTQYGALIGLGVMVSWALMLIYAVLRICRFDI